MHLHFFIIIICHNLIIIFQKMNRKAMAARKNATAAGTRAPGTSSAATEALQKQENDNIKKSFKVGLRCFRI